MTSMASRFRVPGGSRVRLGRDYDPDDTAGLQSKSAARDRLAETIQRLADFQDRLYAQDRESLLIIFQALDAAGKDSAIKHVMSGVNPQGVRVSSFKAPSAEELDHDYLWRSVRALPRRGEIGIFNRSYYEEVLVVRVHRDLLDAQRLPPAKGSIWRRRYQHVNDFERYLADNGIHVLKFFLNVSKGEQKKRFLARIDEPTKNWKFSAADVAEREHWDAYQRAYEKMLKNTSTDIAPWYVIPADHKWFTRLAVATIIGDTLEQIDPRYPVLGTPARRQLLDARTKLVSD